MLIQIVTQTDSAIVITIQGNVVRKTRSRLAFLLLNMSSKIVDDKNQRTLKTILVIDNINFRSPEEQKLLGQALAWRENGWNNRRLIMTSSKGITSKVLKFFSGNLSILGIDAWTLEEYLTAIRNDDFWGGVRHVFSEKGASLDERVTLVESKFYYAGTCARFMFGFPIKEIRQIVHMRIRSLSPETIECPSFYSVHWSDCKHMLMSFTCQNDVAHFDRLVL